MTIHHCPKCELRFTWQTELDDHCRLDHPQFHHDYPVRGEHHDYSASDVQPEVDDADPKKPDHVPTEAVRVDPTTAILNTWWSER